MKHDWQSVPMPDGIAARPRDDRGFPITYVTLIQSDGRPDFTTIDGRKIVQCLRMGLCGMCGLDLDGGVLEDLPTVAFIGGPIAIRHKNFLDPPMHVACAEYAMQVCPHIVINTSRYSKPKQGEGRELYQNVSPIRPDKFGLYICASYSTASHDGQPVFLAGNPIEVRWQA